MIIHTTHTKYISRVIKHGLNLNWIPKHKSVTKCIKVLFQPEGFVCAYVLGTWQMLNKCLSSKKRCRSITQVVKSILSS